MNHLLKTIGLLFGLTCTTFAAVQAQGIQEENMKVFASLPENMVYSSGVGAWASELTIHEDGSFTGYYFDDDMGVTGEGYPHGTRYESEFYGQFEVPAKVTDTIYETMLMYVETKEDPGREEIINQVLYHYSEAAGIAGGDKFTIYLAGTRREELPEAVNYSPRWSYDDQLDAVPEGECVFYNQNAEICFIGYASSAYAVEAEMNFYEVLQDLPSDFVFASGAGAWGNELCIYSDGTFDGSYHDSEMGATGEGYPNGSLYVSNYHGTFSEPVQVSDTAYEMNLLGYDTETPSGQEEIIDELKYIYTEPYGLEFADKMILFLPGTPYADMPEAAQRSPLWMGGSEDGILSEYRYVLYNEEEDLCFFGTKEYDHDVTEDVFEVCEYILPNVSIQYYTEEEIDQLTLQEVNYAKNEIFAIHGRRFVSEELQEYFGSRSWYTGTIDGNDFNTDVFNECESANLELLVKRENKLAGPEGYILNQPGYDIYAVRCGFIDGYAQNDLESYPAQSQSRAVA